MKLTLFYSYSYVIPVNIHIDYIVYENEPVFVPKCGRNQTIKKKIHTNTNTSANTNVTQPR